MKTQISVILFIVSFMCLGTVAFAQGENKTSCDCRKNFDKMIEKVEANYIGYHLTKNEIGKEYESRKAEYGRLASKTDIADCTKVLQHFLSFFKDGHLFVTEFPDLPKEDLDANKLAIKDAVVDVKKLTPTAKAEIGGFWTDGTSKFVVVENKNKKIPYDYVAVIIEANDAAKVGEIKFAVTKSDGKWEGVYYTNAYASRYLSVTPLKENKLLSIWGGLLWGRLDSNESAIYDPSASTIQKLDEKTALLTIPSFLIERPVLDKVINESNLVNEVEYLIIDIRGNTGGNGIYFGLLNRYYEKPMTSEMGRAISSDDNIAYFAKFAGNGTDNPYAPVVADMKSHPKEIVNGPNYGTYTAVPSKNKLKKVVILIDKGDMSAAESFILHSKGVSNKVITMGENTGGVIDYTSINIVKLDCDKHGISLGYPTSALNGKIPLGGYNRTGIAPDVRIESKVRDKVGYVRQYLRSSSE